MVKSERLEFRLTKKDKEIIKRLSSSKGISMSEFIISETVKSN